MASGNSREPSSSQVEVVDTIAIDVDKQLPILLVTIGTGTLQNVLFDGGFGVIMITKKVRLRLGLPAFQATTYKLYMVDQIVVEPLGLIININICNHCIPYFITLTVIHNMEIIDAYSMLLGQPWLIDAKVNHDWENNMVTTRQWNKQDYFCWLEEGIQTQATWGVGLQELCWWPNKWGRRLIFSLGGKLVCCWDNDFAPTKLSRDIDFSKRRISASSSTDLGQRLSTGNGSVKRSCRIGRNHWGTASISNPLLYLYRRGHCYGWYSYLDQDTSWLDEGRSLESAESEQIRQINMGNTNKS